MPLLERVGRSEYASLSNVHLSIVWLQLLRNIVLDARATRQFHLRTDSRQGPPTISSACHYDRCELYQYGVVTAQHGLSCGFRRSLSGLACTSRTLSLVATVSRISLLRTQPAPRPQLLGMSSFAQPAFTHRSRSLTGPPALYLLRRGIQWHLHPAQPTIASTTDWLPYRFSIRSLTGYDRGSHPHG